MCTLFVRVGLLIRMERLQLGTKTGKAKVVGTLICIGGAMVLTFFKGPEVHIWTTNINLLHRNGRMHAALRHRHPIDRILGTLFGVACCFSNAFSLIFQVRNMIHLVLNYNISWKNDIE